MRCGGSISQYLDGVQCGCAPEIDAEFKTLKRSVLTEKAVRGMELLRAGYGDGYEQPVSAG